MREIRPRVRMDGILRSHARARPLPAVDRPRGRRARGGAMKRSAISGDRVLRHAQQLRRHADPRIRAIAMSVIRQRDRERMARRKRK